MTEVTGDPVYIEKVKKVREVLRQIEKPNGLYPNYLNPKTGRWGQRQSLFYYLCDSLRSAHVIVWCIEHTSMGALGDSFYEYLLKSWIQTSCQDVEARQMYDEAMEVQYGHHLVRL